MNVTQSAMSHSLAKLRENFNDTLFERSASGMLPTGKADKVAIEIKLFLKS